MAEVDPETLIERLLLLRCTALTLL